MVEHRSSSDAPDPWSAESRWTVTPLKRVLLCYFLYALAFTLVIPAFPSMLMHVTKGKKDQASTLYGLASCLRFLLEFFSSPYWGNYSDSHGRKKILMLSLSVMSVELLALGAFPSVVTLFATAAMSGMANSAMAVGFAIVTDLSDGRVTSNMGYFSAVFGLGFIVGPLCGSLLIDVSLQLCFLVAGAVCLCSLGFTYLCVEETCLTLRPYDPSKGSPLSSLRVFFANKDLRSLAVPYCLSNLCTGIYFVWVLYMQSRYDATILQIGAFLSVSGACSVMVQGVAVPWLIPTVLSDERATIIGLALSCLQLLAYGFSPALWTFYLILIMLSPASMYGPALKAMLAKTAGPDEQGALQGALGSLRTVTAGLGSLLFTAMFSVSIAVERPKIAGLPFYVAACIYLYSYLHTKHYLKHHAPRKPPPEGPTLRLPNIAQLIFGSPAHGHGRGGHPEETTSLLTRSGSSSNLLGDGSGTASAVVVVAGAGGGSVGVRRAATAAHGHSHGHSHTYGPYTPPSTPPVVASRGGRPHTLTGRGSFSTPSNHHASASAMSYASPPSKSPSLSRFPHGYAQVLSPIVAGGAPESPMFHVPGAGAGAGAGTAGDDDRKLADDAFSESDASSLQQYLVRSSLSLFGDISMTSTGGGGGGGGGHSGANSATAPAAGPYTEVDLSFEESFYSTKEDVEKSALDRGDRAGGGDHGNHSLLSL